MNPDILWSLTRNRSITPPSPDLMVVDHQGHGDNFPNDHDNDYQPPLSPLWRRPSITPATASTSRSTTLKRSRSPTTTKLESKLNPDMRRRRFAPPQEGMCSNVKKETPKGKSAMLRAKPEPMDIIELSDEEVENLIVAEPPAKVGCGGFFSGTDCMPCLQRRNCNPSTPPRHSTSIEFPSDSEDDADWDHPGLDLNDPDVVCPRFLPSFYILLTQPSSLLS